MTFNVSSLALPHSSHAFFNNVFFKLFLVFSGVLLFKRFVSKRNRLPLPPGPRGLPFLGAFTSFPSSSRDWETFTEWSQKWGDIVYTTVMGQPILVLSSAKVATDMLAGKGAIHSDRPVASMAKLSGWDKALAISRAGPLHKRYRADFATVVGSAAKADKFSWGIEEEAQKFVRKLQRKPNKLNDYLRDLVVASILKISHGYSVSDSEEVDPFVSMAEKALAEFLDAILGKWLVNYIPSLAYLPDWFPGMGFKTVVKGWNRSIRSFLNEPYIFVQKQMVAGKATPSLTSSLIERYGGEKISQQDEEIIKWSGSSFYGAGADTSTATLNAFFIAMALYPDVLKRAQAEVDSVLGDERLPQCTGKDKLPYINALVKELLRWHAVFPTNLPHLSTEDDIHEGYFIPKGTIVFANIHFMLHDPRIYSDPFTFNPSRFLGNKQEKDPRDICFGFGRRICPGMYIAESIIFTTVTTTLALMDIKKKSLNGRVIEPVYKCADGPICHPAHYEVSITVRPHKAALLAA